MIQTIQRGIYSRTIGTTAIDVFFQGLYLDADVNRVWFIYRRIHWCRIGIMCQILATARGER